MLLALATLAFANPYNDAQLAKHEAMTNHDPALGDLCPRGNVCRGYSRKDGLIILVVYNPSIDLLFLMTGKLDPNGEGLTGVVYYRDWLADGQADLLRRDGELVRDYARQDAYAEIIGSVAATIRANNKK